MITEQLRKQFGGLHLTMVTPFARDMSVDETALAAVVDRVIADGVDVINYPLTAGEGASLTFDEHKRVIELVARHVGKRVPFLAGAVRASTSESLEIARHAAAVGADGIITMNPFYFQLSQDEMYVHHSTLAAAVDVPVVVYNHPAATKSSMSAATAKKLAQLPNVVGFFPTNLDVGELYTYSMELGDSLLLIGGREEVLPIVGAIGFHAQSTSSFQFAPQLVRSIWNAAMARDDAAAAAGFRTLAPWRALVRRKVDAGFFSAFATYTKASLQLLGRPVGTVRPPAQPLSGAELEDLQAVLNGMSLTAESAA